MPLNLLLAGKESLSAAGEVSRLGDDLSFWEKLLTIPFGSIGSRLVTGRHQETPQIGGQPALGANLEDLATREREAIRADVGAQLSSTLGQSSISEAQRGVLRSGGTDVRQDRLREAALRATAAASAGVGIQVAGLQQRASEAQRTFDLQVAQLEAQKDIAQVQMLTNIFAAGAELAPDFLSWIGGNQGVDVNTLAPDQFGPANMLESSPLDFDFGGVG